MVSNKKKIIIYIILSIDIIAISLAGIYCYTELFRNGSTSVIKDSVSYIPGNKILNNLSRFYVDDSKINTETNAIVAAFGQDELIGQQIVVSLGSNGKKWEEVRQLMMNKQIGGILLTGASVNEEVEYVKKIRATEKENKLIPVLISFDGEPFLINQRFKDDKILSLSKQIQNISELNSISITVSKLLDSIGVNQNYAPVCDVPIKGSLLEKRGFSVDSNFVRIYSLLFSLIMQQNGIIATGKHFPGHGNVIGDSHKEIVFIDGDLKELGGFKYLINNGIISIMVGHIAIRNNQKYETDNIPSSLSRKIVTGLLREELGFKGLIVTDAMNMGAVINLKTPSLNAIRAGCDMVLMPSDELKLIESVKSEMESNNEFDIQVHDSVRRIIKLKKCLGLF